MFVPRSPTAKLADHEPTHLHALLSAKWTLDNLPLPPCPFPVVPSSEPESPPPAQRDTVVVLGRNQPAYTSLLAAASGMPHGGSGTETSTAGPEITLADLPANSTLATVAAADARHSADIGNGDHGTLSPMQRELDQARLDLSSLQRENSFLRSALDAAQRDLRAASELHQQQRDQPEAQHKECTQCQEYESYVSRLESESIFLRERTRDLSLEVDHLRDQLDHQKQPDTAAQTTTNPLSSSTRSDSPSQSTMVDQAQIAALTNVSDELKRQLDAANDRARALENALIERDHALDSVSSDLLRLRTDHSNVQSQLESLQSERNTLHDERSMLLEQRRVVIEKFDERVHAEVGARIKEEVEKRVAEELPIRVRQAMEGAQLELDSAASLVNELEVELAAEKTESVRLHRANAGLVEEVEALKLALQMDNKEVHAREEQLMRENHDLHMKLERAQSQLRVLQSTVDQVMNSPNAATASPTLNQTPWSPSSSARPGSVSFRLDTSSSSSPGPAAHVSGGPGSPTLLHRSLAMNHTASQPNLRASFYGQGAGATTTTPSSTSMTLPRSPAPQGSSPYTPHQHRPYSMVHEAWTEETPVRNASTPTGDTSYSDRSTPAQHARPMSMITPPSFVQQQSSEPVFSDAKWRQQVETARQLELQLRELIAQKESLQGDYSRVPLAATTLNRRRKEELEAKLDEVDREIGSVRRRLKTMNFL